MLLVFDLDNTLSDAQHRSHLAAEKKWDEFHALCEQDVPIQSTCWLLDDMAKAGNQIVILTGRPASFDAATLRWFEKNRITFDRLFMRPVGDYSHDHEYKLHALDAIAIELHTPKNEIIVFEDRESVVKALRGAGYTVYQVRESLY